MHPIVTRKRLALGLLLAILLVLGLLAQDYRLFERAWFNAQQWRQAAQWQDESIWLTDYRVVIEAQPIVGLDDDVSALTYDPDRRSLFTVTNQNSELIPCASNLGLQAGAVRRCGG